MTRNLLPIADLALLIHMARTETPCHRSFEKVLNRFVDQIRDDGLALEARIGSLWANGEAIHSTAPGAALLTDALLVRDVGHLTIPADASRGAIEELARAFAVDGGSYLTFDGFAATLTGETQRMLQLGPSGMGTIHGSIPRPAQTGPALVREAPTNHGDLILVRRAIDQVPETDRSTRDEERSAEAAVERLMEQGRLALDTDHWDALVTTGLALIEGAAGASSEAVACGYRIAQRRLFARRALFAIARLVGDNQRRSDATTLLRHLGGEATEVLMELLVTEEDMTARRCYYSALTTMTENAAVIIHHLAHPVWYVVRNAAELCGDMDLLEAIPDLARQVNHPDERVRRSVAGALAKLGTAAVIDPLRTVLRDVSPAVRLEALVHLDGRRRGRGMAMILAAVLDQEEHPDVRREILRALGRIGTTDAIQAILRAARPGPRALFRPRNRTQRLEAVEALALAGPAAGPALRTLLEDADRDVRRAANDALASVA